MEVTAFAENPEESLRANSVRVALGLFSFVGMPLALPNMNHYWWVMAGYTAGAVGIQLAIRANVGGIARVLLGGMMDVAFVTFLVHRLGSQSTPLVAAYLLSGMFVALVAPAWSARLLGALGVAAYGGVCFAEAIHLLPYAPDIPHLAAYAPDVGTATRATVLVGVLVAVSTWVSDRIARALRLRERQLRQANAQLAELSQRDPLTQLYNRRYLVQRVEEELGRVRRGHSTALLMMDLDGFKHVNDTQGHLAGDELLRKIAVTIGESTREIDVVGRFGGDEFVALLPDTDGEQAAAVAERLVRTIRDVGTFADPRRPVTVSVGVAIALPEDDVTLLLNTADDGAYLAKQAGGDCVRAARSAATPATATKLGSGPRAARAG
jgi:diguanylate cyclase (GGDEF)-like protein